MVSAPMQNLPRDRWRLTEVVNSQIPGDPWFVAHGYEFNKQREMAKLVLAWLRRGALRAYGRPFQGGRKLSIDQSQPFEAIEPERWLPSNWDGNSDELYEHSTLSGFNDVFVDRREALRLIADAPPAEATETLAKASRGRRPQHDRERFWRIVAAAFVELPKQAAFIAEVQQAYIDLQGSNEEPPGETFLKERYAELGETFNSLRISKRAGEKASKTDLG